MARVEIGLQGWGWVVDAAGHPLGGRTVTLKRAGTTDPATTYSAITGGTSSTSALTTASDGTLPGFIDEGSYDLTVSGVPTRRVEALSGDNKVTGYSSVKEFGAKYGAADNSAAWQAAADSGVARVYAPEGYGNLDGTVKLTTKQHWFGDMTTVTQADYGRRTFEIQPSAAGSTIEGFAGGYLNAKPVGDQSITLAQFAAESDTMIAQDAATTRSAFVYNMADGVTVRHLDLQNVFTGIRGRSSDKYSTQMYDMVIHDVKLRHHDFGLVVSNAINFRVDGVHGRDTDLSTLNPPHLMYFATFADAPDDSLTGNEDATHVDTVSEGGYIANCTDYNNPYGAGSSYKFENLRGTKIDNLSSTRTARGLEVLYGDNVSVRGFKAHEGIDATGTDSQQAMLIVSDSVRCSVEGHDIDLLTTASGVAQDVRGVMVRDSTRCTVRGGMVRTKYDPADTGSRAQYAVDTCTEITLDEVGCQVTGREHTPIFLSGSSNCRVIRPRVWKENTTWVSIVRTDVNGATASNNNSIVIDPYALNFTPTTSSFTDTGTGNSKIIENTTTPHISFPQRSSDVSTLVQGADGIATQTPTAGAVTAAVAMCLVAGTYTKIRFAVGGTLTSVTDIRLMVADSSRAKLAETANLVGLGGITAPAVNTLIDNIPLLTSVTLTRDQIVYLGVGNVGTTFTFLGVSDGLSTISTLAPPGGVQRIAQSTWAGGTMPTTIATAGSSRVPWIELVP